MSRNDEWARRDYKCLFPWVYSHQDTKWKRADPETTSLPNLRVVGPMWSFGMRARDFGRVQIDGSSLEKDQMYALRLMYELGNPGEVPPPDFPGLRRPMLFSAVVESFSTTDRLEEETIPGAPYRGRRPAACRDANKRDRWRGQEKLSLLAVKTFDDLECNHSRKRRPFRYLDKDQGIQPLHDKAPIIGDGAVTVTLAPIGDPPHHKESRGELSAMQLLQGQVGMEPDLEYLRKVRAQLGIELDKDSTDKKKNRIYLLPDGFGIYGSVTLPWRPIINRRVEGWLKITYRTGESSAGRIERVMRPWKGPNQEGTDCWTERVDEFATRIVQLDAPNHKARWLDIAASASLEPEDFFWALRPDPDFDFLVCRDADDGDIYLDDRGLICRLAYRVGDEAPLSSLTVEPGQFRLSPLPNDKEGFTISSGSSPDAKSIGKLSTSPTVTCYEFESQPKRTEKLFIKDSLELAVPLVETSSRLRTAMRIAEPEQGRDLGLLWTFVPLGSGYLHLPLPNATLSAINRLLVSNPEKPSENDVQAVGDSLLGDSTQHVDSGALSFVNTTLSAFKRWIGVEPKKPDENSLPEEDDSQSEERPRRIVSGALSFFNRPEAPGYDNQQRVWSYSLSNVQDIDLLLKISIVSEWRLESAQLEMNGGEVSMDGFLTLIPYRQKPSRLLPDHADRALNTMSITALSPGLLRGIEERMWRQSEQTTVPGDSPGKALPPAVRMMAILKGLQFELLEEGSLAQDGVSNVAKGTKSTRLAVGGDVVLNTLFRMPIPENQNPSQVPDPESIQPWLWLRHQSLPFVQSQPLALAGPDQRQPSGSRELAPLRRLPLKDDSSELLYNFPGAMDMGASVFELEMDGEWIRPTCNAAWRDEVGMAGLTLPSLSLFPGLQAQPREGRHSPAGLSWCSSTRVNHPLELELRHDLAYRDEFYAGASLPQTDSDADSLPTLTTLVAPSTPVADDLFAIRTDNGPDGMTSAAEPASVWQRHWRKLNRMLALAATDQRGMVCEGEDGVLFHGPFGESTQKVQKIQVSNEIKIDDEGDASHPFADGQPTQILESIGSVTILFSTSGGTDNTLPLEFRGLPDESDLIGLHGSFKRQIPSTTGQQDTPTQDVDFGTAQLSMAAGAEKVFLDQRGLQVSYLNPAKAGRDELMTPTERGSRVRFNLRAGQIPGNQKKARFRLLSLEEPIKAGSLRFWCSDVPLDADKNSAHEDINAHDSWGLANSAGFDTNHLLGYRWHLGDASEPPSPYEKFGLIPVEGLLFEPLRLVGVVLNELDGPSRFEILGRVRLAVSESTSLPPPLSSGEIKLVLDRQDGTMEFKSKLEECDTAEPIEWLLAEPSSSTGPVPRLRLKKWPVLPPADGKVNEAEGILSFELGGVFHNSDILLKRHWNGTFECELVAPDSPSKGTVQTNKIEISTKKEEDKIVRPTQLMATLEAHLVSGQVEAIVTLTSDLLANQVWSLRNDSNLNIPGFGKMGIKQNSSPLGKSVAVFFASGVLGISWVIDYSSLENSSTRPRLLNAFDVESGYGTLTAVLAPDKTINSGHPGPSFNAVDVRLDGKLSLDVYQLGSTGANDPQKLQLAMEPADRSLRISGNLKIDNWFEWPEVEFYKDAPTKGWTQCKLGPKSKIRFKHAAEVRLDRQKLDLEGVEESLGLLLPAVVNHELMGLQKTHDEQICKWSSFQLLRIRTLASLVKESESFGSLSAGSKDRFNGHLSYLGVNDAKAFGLESLNHGDLLFEPDAAHYAAISGRLRDKLIEDIIRPSSAPTSQLRGAVVEFSAHHQLYWLNGGVEQGAVLPLPAISFLCSKQEERSFSESTIHLFTSYTTEAVTFYVPDSELVSDYASRLLDSRTRQQAVRFLQSKYSEVAQGNCDLVNWMVHGCDHSSQANWHRPIFQSHGIYNSASGLRLIAQAYPGLPIGTFLAKLGARNVTARPEAYTYSQLGVLNANDLVPSDSPKYNKENIDQAIRCYRKWAYRNLLASPDRVLGVRKSVISTGVTVLELFTSNRAGTRIQSLARIERRVDAGDTSQDDEINLDWGRRSLQRLAPWSRMGLLLATSSVSGSKSRRSGYFELDVSNEKRPDAPAELLRPKPRQGQYSTHMTGVGQLSDHVAAGFIPISAGAGLYASEDGFVPGTISDGPRLTATGAEMSWVLPGGDTSVFPSRDENETSTSYWIADRFRVSYRNSSPHNQQKKPVDDELIQPPLTHALPKGFHAQMPGALLPAANLVGPSNTPEALTSWQQHVLPGYSEIGRISARAGVWATNRLGILASGKTGARATPEMPVHLRTPRPPLLALNDRPRASSHEAGHLALTQGPTAILHGARARRAGSATEPLGLDRRPRSERALVLGLEDPKQPELAGGLSNGLLTNGWSGSLELIDTRAISNSQTDGWILESKTRLVLVVGGNSYSPRSAKSGDTGDAVSFPASLLGTSFSDFYDSEDNRLQDVIRGFSLGTPVQLVAQIYLPRESNGTSAYLYRKITLDLFWAGTADSLMERPVYARFDDPEYNDRLEGVAKLDRQPTPRSKGDELIFAADRPDVRVDDRIEIAIGLRASQAGTAIDSPFSRIDPYAALKVDDGPSKLIGLSFSRLRSGSDGVSQSGAAFEQEVPFELSGVEGINVEAKPRNVKCYKIPIPGETATVLSTPGYDLSNAALVDATAPPPDPEFLTPGDQVVVTLFAFKESDGVGKDPELLAKLVLDVVSQPLTPANPSAFALLEFAKSTFEPHALVLQGQKNSDDPEDVSSSKSADRARVSVPLYASGPPAAIIELVDPLDLLDGIVRRRAIYQWQFFTRISAVREYEERAYTIQKINAVGGSWLPSDFEGDWIALEKK